MLALLISKVGPFAVGVGVAAGVVDTGLDDTVSLLGGGGAVSLLDSVTGAAGLIALFGLVVVAFAGGGLVAGFFGAYHHTKKIESKEKKIK